MFTNGPENRGSIPGRVIPKTQKMLIDAAFDSNQHYKVRIKVKVKQSRDVVTVEKGAFGLHSTKVVNFTYICDIYIYIYVFLV